MKRLLSDTFALAIFSTLGAFTVEYFLVGLSLEQTLWTRLLALPAIVLTAYPYGLYHDVLLSIFPGRSRLRLLLLDTFAFLSFQMPIYAGLLWINGANGAQIIAAVTASVGVITLSGRPYGLFMEACRTLFRAHPA